MKLLMMPPLERNASDWSRRLTEAVPELTVVLAADEATARREVVDADATYGWVPPEALAGAEKLKWLQSPAAGPQKGFYYPELIEHPVVVCNPRSIYSDHIAQHIMMYVLALARGLPFYMDAQRDSRWDGTARKKGYVDLTTASALIVGVGGIGHETARLCQAFGMKVMGIDPRWEFPANGVERFGPEDLERLLPEADFVILTIPQTPATEGLFGAEQFSLMKPSAYFINIGRGATTRLDDLVAALESNGIAGAGLDVFEQEPLPAEHPLWQLQNVILTPHIAVRDAENIAERRFQVLLENAKRFAKGETLLNVVDKAAWY